MPNKRTKKVTNINRDFSIFPSLDNAEAKFVLYRLAGYSYQNIAREFKCSTTTIREFACVYGEKAYEKYFSSIDTIKELLKTKSTISMIANRLDYIFFIDNKRIKLDEKGLRNLLHDTGLERTINIKTVKSELKKGKTIAQLADYYGKDYKSFRNILEKNNIRPSGSRRLRTKDGSCMVKEKIYPSDLITLSKYQTNCEYSDNLLHEYESEEKRSIVEEIERNVYNCQYHNSILSCSNDPEVINSEIEHCFEYCYNEYSRVSSRRANISNFFYNTMVKFSECSRKSGEPDLIVGNPLSRRNCSRYWFTPRGVIRASRQWGVRQLQCEWALVRKDGSGLYWEANGGKLPLTHNLIYGLAKWEDFVFKSYITEQHYVEEDIVLSKGIVKFERTGKVIRDFCNTCYGDVYQNRQGNELGPISSKKGFDIREYLLS